MNAPREIRGRGIVDGQAGGRALVAKERISFLGDLDIRTGEIIGQLPSVKGQRLGGTVLVMPSNIGSAGSWRFLYQLYVHGTHPVAIVSQSLPDPSLVQGAILAKIPIVSETAEDVVEAIKTGDRVEVDGTQGVIRITAQG